MPEPTRQLAFTDGNERAQVVPVPHCLERSQRGRPSTSGQQAPRLHRRPGHPARGVAGRRQQQRRHSTSAPARQEPGRGRRRTAQTHSFATPATTATSTADCSGSPVIAERGHPHGSGPGVFSRVVERTISWLYGFRRLRIRWERCDDIHEAFLGLATCLITHRHMRHLCYDLMRWRCDRPRSPFQTAWPGCAVSRLQLRLWHPLPAEGAVRGVGEGVVGVGPTVSFNHSSGVVLPCTTMRWKLGTL